MRVEERTHALQQIAKAGQAVFWSRGEIGADEERGKVLRIEEHGQRPAAAASLSAWCASW